MQFRNYPKDWPLEPIHEITLEPSGLSLGTGLYHPLTNWKALVRGRTDSARKQVLTMLAAAMPGTPI